MTPPQLECWYRGKAAGPSLHALVIGTSDYPHRPLDLEDLPGAATSALMFAAWLRNSYPGEGRTVGSIRLLLAPSDGELDDLGWGQGTHLSDRATVHRALLEWQRDCMTSPDNIAVLYVCGHGVQETDDGALVFVHDAGEDPLDAALDIAGVRAGMNGDSSPRRQWYFADACRIPSPKLDQFKGPLHGSLSLRERSGARRGHRPVFFAAEPDALSWQSDAGSVFVRALRQCLDLDARVPLNDAAGGWGVTATSLHDALLKRVPALARRGGEYQSVTLGGSLTNATFLECGPPLVPVTVRVVPAEAQNVPGCGAEIFDGDTARRVLQRRALPVADVPVVSGVWTLAVTFDRPTPPYVDKPAIGLDVRPPRVDKQVNLR